MSISDGPSTGFILSLRLRHFSFSAARIRSRLNTSYERGAATVCQSRTTGQSPGSIELSPASFKRFGHQEEAGTLSRVQSTRAIELSPASFKRFGHQEEAGTLSSN